MLRLVPVLELLFCCAIVHGSEILFDREETAEEKNKYHVYKTQNFFTGEHLGPEDILARYKNRKWGPEVLKISLKRVSREAKQPDDISKYPTLEDGTPYIEIEYLGEVLFEKALKDSELLDAKIGYREEHFNDDVTADIIKSKISREQLSASRDLIKVELLYGGMDPKFPYIHPYLLVSEIQGWKSKDEAAKKLEAELRNTYAVGSSIRNFKYLGFSVREGVYEAVVSPDGTRFDIEQRFVGDKSKVRHELIRHCMSASKNTIEKSDFGYVVKSDYVDERSHKVVYAWESESDHIIMISACSKNETEDFSEILKCYGGKFKSSLPENVTIDRDVWARSQVEECFDGLHALLSDKADFDLPKSYTLFIELQSILEIPETHEINFPADREAVERLLVKLETSWKSQASKMVWDTHKCKLVSTSSAKK